MGLGALRGLRRLPFGGARRGLHIEAKLAAMGHILPETKPAYGTYIPANA